MTDSLRQKASAAYLDDDFQSAINFFTQVSATPLRATEFPGRSCHLVSKYLMTPYQGYGAVSSEFCFIILR